MDHGGPIYFNLRSGMISPGSLQAHPLGRGKKGALNFEFEKRGGAWNLGNFQTRYFSLHRWLTERKMCFSFFYLLRKKKKTRFRINNKRNKYNSRGCKYRNGNVRVTKKNKINEKKRNEWKDGKKNPFSLQKYMVRIKGGGGGWVSIPVKSRSDNNKTHYTRNM